MNQQTTAVENAIARLKKMRPELAGKHEDPETFHIEADEILLRILRMHGLGQLADAFEEACNESPFWYS